MTLTRKQKNNALQLNSTSIRPTERFAAAKQLGFSVAAGAADKDDSGLLEIFIDLGPKCLLNGSLHVEIRFECL